MAGLLGLVAAGSATLAPPTAPDLAAQAPGDARVTGTIRTPTGEPLARVLVTLLGPAGEARSEVRADAWGRYSLELVRPGTYGLRLEQVGHHPVRVSGLELGAGETLALDLTMEPAEAARARVRAVRARPAPTTGALADRDALRTGVRLLPSRATDIEAAARIARGVTAVSFEGLPRSWLPVSFAGQSAGAFGGLHGGSAARLLPASFLGSASVVSYPDAEWSAPAGAALDVRPARPIGLEIVAAGGARDLLYGDDPGPGGADVFAHAAFGGPPGAGTSFWGAAAWNRRGSGSLPRAELDAEFGLARETAAGRGFPLDEPPADIDVVAVAGGLTSRATGQSWFRLSGLFAGALQEPAAGPLDPGFEPAAHRGGLVRAEYLVRPVDAGDLGLETRVDYALNDARPAGDGAPETLVATSRLLLGRSLADRTEQTWSASQAAYVTRGAHRLKGALWGELVSAGIRLDPRRGAARAFGTRADLSAGRGVAALLADRVPTADFITGRFGGLLQDTWQLGREARLLAGVRVFADYLPASDIELERSWYFATGEANTAVERFHVGVEPRLALDAFLDRNGAARAFASAAVHFDRLDHRAMAEVLTNDGRQTVRSWYGALGQWPTPSGAPAAEGKSLSLPGATFAPPRTLRVEAGLSRRIGEHALARVAGTFRATDRLLTRSDANFRGAPWGSDSHGRTVWTPLVDAGELIVGSPEARVQLADFDRVWRLDAGAESHYVGVTGELRIEWPGGTLLSGRYTFSSARDDWASPAFAEPDLAAPAAFRGAPEQPGRGTSDYDIPHQALAELALPLPAPGRPVVSLLYSFTSGLPFTPAMGHGIDADGDGLFNDVAFIDPQAPGLQTLLDEWSCLRDHVGTFAGRNGCRADPVHRLDAAASVALAGRGDRRVALRVEVLGVVSTRFGVTDAALYRPVPGEAPVVSGATVALPLEANPGFGEVLLDLSAVRALRIGAEIAF